MEYQGVSSFPNIFFSCFIVFLYMSAGCVSTFSKGGSGPWKSTFTKDSTTLFKQITGG